MKDFHSLGVKNITARSGDRMLLLWMGSIRTLSPLEGLRQIWPWRNRTFSWKSTPSCWKLPGPKKFSNHRSEKAEERRVMSASPILRETRWCFCIHLKCGSQAWHCMHAINRFRTGAHLIFKMIYALKLWICGSERSLFQALILGVRLSAVIRVGKTIHFCLFIMYDLALLVISVIQIIPRLGHDTNVNHSI